MTYKKIQYSGNTLLKINFGLYNVDDDLNFEDTKINIKENFENEKLKDLKRVLSFLGLKFISLVYYSPKAYNFSNDSLDIVLRVSNKKVLRDIIMLHKDEINDALKDNKSYDGYISLTRANIYEELERLNKVNYEPDILVLATLISIYEPTIKDFEPYLYYVLDEEENV